MKKVGDFAGMDRDEKAYLVALIRMLSPTGMEPESATLDTGFAQRIRSRLPRPPRAVLFDVYGTLLRSDAGAEPAGNSPIPEGENRARDMLIPILDAWGFTLTPEAFACEVDRAIRERRMELLARTPHPEVDIRQIISRLLPSALEAEIRRLAVLLEAWRNPCSPMPGAAELLRRLKKRGLRLGIVSNAQFYTPLALEALVGYSPEDLGFERDLCVYSYELQKAKPDTSLFEKAIQPLIRFGLKADQIVVVGNSWKNDIESSQKLGCMTVLFAGDARSFRPPDQGSVFTPPDSILTNLLDFESVIF
jgi:putative hydrolase of the HAD superfamily